MTQKKSLKPWQKNTLEVLRYGFFILYVVLLAGVLYGASFLHTTAPETQTMGTP